MSDATNTEMPIQLEAEVTIAQAGELKGRLTQFLDGERSPELDGSAVEHIDTAALQLLVAFVREAEARDRKPSWRGASEVLIEAAQQIGVAELLHLGPG